MFVITVLWITLKRIVHNWRIVAGIAFGIILAAGIVSSIPIYSAGSMQKSFINNWIAESTFRPPLAIIITHDNEHVKHDVTYDDLVRLRSYLENKLESTFQSPATNRARFARLGTNPVLPGDTGPPTFTSPKGDLVEMDNIEELSEIVIGRWFEPRDDGVVEVVVDETTFENEELIIGDVFSYWYQPRENEVGQRVPDELVRNGYITVPVEIVGMFRAKRGYTTEQWIYPPPFSGRMFAHPEVFEDYLLSGDGLGLRARSYDMQWVFDHTALRVSRLPEYLDAFERIEDRATDIAPVTRFWHSPWEYFKRFELRREQISRFLLALGMPAIGIVLYYIVLLAAIYVDHRKKEIAVMLSRGGDGKQVVLSLLLEWLLLGGLAVAAGPLLGMFVARLLSASAGFLDFSNRPEMHARYTTQALRYSGFAALTAVIAAMLPVINGVRQSIVTFVQRRARSRRRSVWHRYYLDVIILGGAVFGYARFSWETLSLEPGEQVLSQPALFLVPVAMAAGAGLILLRFFPVVLALFRWTSSRLPGVLWQFTFRRLTRNTGEYIPLMLLLIVTVSTGIYSAAAARTLQVNFEDQIRYQVGADLATEEVWQPPEGPSYRVVSEPPFLRRLELAGVSSAARVKRHRVEVRTDYRLSSGAGSAAGTAARIPVEMMAIDPREFARTAWYRDDFGDADFIEYLSLLTRHPEGILIHSEAFLDSGLELGQPLTLIYRGQEVPVYAAGWIDFWPTLDPFERPFIIMNLNHLHDYSALEPYDVWYRFEDYGSPSELVKSLTGIGVYVTRIRDARAELQEMRREPYRMGFFGQLSMGFLVSAVITALGFFVFTFFTIRGRIVQLGALRAMGLSSSKLVVMVGLEQLVTITAGLGIGAFLGSLIARLFIPLFRFRIGSLNPVPPFIVLIENADMWLIVAVIALLFVLVIATLSIVLSRMRINQAIKLGEEV